jgi:3-oxoacyl-[acyl-carrier protein] reductase
MEGLVSLDGRVAMITGSSRGIGRAIALKLASMGADIAVNYLTQKDEADKVVAAVVAQGQRAIAFQANVAKSEDVQQMFRGIIDAWGRVDILVNNAGIIKDSLLVRMSEPDWDSVLDTSLRGTYLCTRAALRSMLQNRWGRVINIGSVVGIAGNVGQANYASAKAGVIGFTRSVAKEVATRNITVNYIAPGYIATEIVERLPQELKDRLMTFIPMKRFGNAEEVAHLAGFLAAPETSYVTGQVINIDGGMVLT